MSNQRSVGKAQSETRIITYNPLQYAPAILIFRICTPDCSAKSEAINSSDLALGSPVRKAVRA